MIQNQKESFRAAKKITIGGVSGVTATILTKLLSVLFYFIIFWFGDKEEAGLFLLSLSFIGIIGAFLSLGLPATVNRFVAYYYGKKEYFKLKELFVKGLFVSFVFSLFIALGIFVFREPLTSFYGIEKLNNLTNFCVYSFFCLL